MPAIVSMGTLIAGAGNANGRRALVLRGPLLYLPFSARTRAALYLFCDTLQNREADCSV